MEKKSRKVNRRKEAIAPPVNANGVVLEAIECLILNNWELSMFFMFNTVVNEERKNTLSARVG